MKFLHATIGLQFGVNSKNSLIKEQFKYLYSKLVDLGKNKKGTGSVVFNGKFGKWEIFLIAVLSITVAYLLVFKKRPNWLCHGFEPMSPVT